MLLCMHVTKVLFLVPAGNFALTMDFYCSYTLLSLVARSYAFLLQLWRKSCLISGFASWQVVSNVQNKICNRKPRLKAILGVAREQLKVLHTVEAL